MAKDLKLPLRVMGSAYSLLKADSLLLAEEMISKSYTDFVGYGRQSFADPLFPKKLMNGEAVNYCTGCSGCSRLMAAQMNDGCVLYDEYYKGLMKNMRK